jgi:hypothetical protein
MINTENIEPSICWTVLPDVHGKKIDEFEDSSDGFIDYLSSATAIDKKSCPLLTLVDFGDKKSSSGSLRNNDNVIKINGVIGDYDEGNVDIAEAQRLLTSAGIFSILYPTPSSTPEKPRWRVIAPISKQMPPTEHGPLTDRLNKALGGILARESFTLSQTYYFGDVGTNNYRVIKVDGVCIDKLEPLQEVNEPKQSEPIKQASSNLFLAPSLIDDLQSALEHMPSDNRELWIRMGHALKTIGNSGRDLWVSWSSKSSKFNLQDAERTWESFSPTDIGYQAVFAEAGRQGWENPLKGHSHKGEDALLKFDEFESLRINLLDIDSSDEEPLPHIVDKWIPENEVALLGGHGGGGKSMLALSLGIHVALGLPFGGLTTNQSNVAFYSAEDSGRVLRYRFRKLCRSHHINPKDLDGKLHLLDVSDIDPTLHRGRGFSTAKTETASLMCLSQYVEKHNISFCIIDNASDTFDDEEIKRSPVRTFMRSIRSRIARPNRAVLLLAHINKANAKGGKSADSEDYSGSTAWHNSVRSRLSLNSDKASGVLTITHHKANLGELAEPILFEWINGVPIAGVQNPDREAQLLAQQANENARDINDKGVLAEIIQKLTNRGEHVSTSITGGYSTFNSLKGDSSFPKVLDAERFKRLIREMQDEQIIVRKVVKTPSRKNKEVFVCVAPMSPPFQDLVIRND